MVLFWPSLFGRQPSPDPERKNQGPCFSSGSRVLLLIDSFDLHCGNPFERKSVLNQITRTLQPWQRVSPRFLGGATWFWGDQAKGQRATAPEIRWNHQSCKARSADVAPEAMLLRSKKSVDRTKMRAFRPSVQDIAKLARVSVSLFGPTSWVGGKAKGRPFGVNVEKPCDLAGVSMVINSLNLSTNRRLPVMIRIRSCDHGTHGSGQNTAWLPFGVNERFPNLRP